MSFLLGLYEFAKNIILYRTHVLQDSALLLQIQAI